MTYKLMCRTGSRKNSVPDTGPQSILLGLVIKDSVTLGFAVNDSRRKVFAHSEFCTWGM